jgi:hypothetical protein
MKQHGVSPTFTFKGAHHSEESKQKICLAHLGKKKPPLSDEHKKKIGESQHGRKRSLETRVKMRKKRIEYMAVHPFTKKSKSATRFLNELELIWNVKIIREFVLGGRYFDGKVGNLLIEVDGSYWHTLPKIIKISKQKECIAKENGYELKRFSIDTERDVPIRIEQIQKGLI